MNSLFQLAVLAFEQEEYKKSKEIFIKRVNIAKSNKLDNDTINRMQIDLDSYYKKMQWLLYKQHFIILRYYIIINQVIIYKTILQICKRDEKWKKTLNIT